MPNLSHHSSSLLLITIYLLSITNASCFIIGTRINNGANTNKEIWIQYAKAKAPRKKQESNAKSGTEEEPKKDLTSLTHELNSNFKYDNRIQAPDNEADEYRCGYVSILGLPNMGKSTLTNQLLDAGEIFLT